MGQFRIYRDTACFAAIVDGSDAGRLPYGSAEALADGVTDVVIQYALIDPTTPGGVERLQHIGPVHYEEFENQAGGAAGATQAEVIDYLNEHLAFPEIVIDPATISKTTAINVPFTHQLELTVADIKGVNWTLCALDIPDGVCIAAHTGELFGTPLPPPGVYKFQVYAVAPFGGAEATFTLTITAV